MDTVSPEDLAHLNRALDLAQEGNGRVSPNPLVGAVVVKDGEIVGEGFHARYGEAHAERVALAECGDLDLRGATMYVSLEPCAHTGQTPPCTDAILEAGIARVVIASDDPSEKASGKGVELLRSAGVEVVFADHDGGIAHRARLLNQPFRKHSKTGRPHIIFKIAMSLDGKIATHTGSSKWISSEKSRALVHLWRSQCDAVAIGLGTARADDPLLMARGEHADRRQPRRVVFDSEARISKASQLVKTASEVPLTVVVSRAAPRAALEALTASGVDLVTTTGENETVRIHSALDQLGAAGVTSILLEGGPYLAGAFFDAGEIDEVRTFIAPIVIGGVGARQPIEGVGADEIADALRASSVEVEQIGQDVLIRARLREC